MKNIVVAFCCLMILPVLAAQKRTGNIVGTVVDFKGNTIAGVSIEATSPKLVGKATAVTAGDGSYHLFSLPSDIYEVTFILQGFKTLNRWGLIVQLSQTITLNVTLEQAVLEEQITVIAKSPIIDVKSNTPVYLAPFIRGESVQVKDKDGLTPLHMAASEGSKNEAERLIAEGADVNVKTADGWTPLHMAAYEGALDLAELLISKGAAVNSGDDNGWTPLHSAAASGSDDVAKLLIAKGANLNAKTADGWTPLHAAADNESLAVAELLIAKGTDVKAKTASGETPLHYSAKRGADGVAEQLIAKGADVNAKGKDGRTPLHNAAGAEYSEALAQLLIDKGADVKAKDMDGRTALVLAAAGGHADMAELLRKHGARM